jgi:hypothetical protein
MGHRVRFWSSYHAKWKDGFVKDLDMTYGALLISAESDCGESVHGYRGGSERFRFAYDEDGQPIVDSRVKF